MSSVIFPRRLPSNCAYHTLGAICVSLFTRRKSPLIGEARTREVDRWDESALVSPPKGCPPRNRRFSWKGQARHSKVESRPLEKICQVGQFSRLSRVITRPADGARIFLHPRVESGRIRRCWISHGSSQVGSYKVSKCHGSGRITPDPTRPDPREGIRPVKSTGNG